MALPTTTNMDYSQDGSPFVRIDLVGTSAALDVSQDGSPWVGITTSPAGGPVIPIFAYHYAQLRAV